MSEALTVSPLLSHSTPKILILEDDQDMREMLTEVLESQGYEVTAVASGLAAVEEAAKSSYALIVADIRMKGMNGLEALAKTKSYQPDIGSLVVSGYATPEETERAAELGVGAYLKKPFRMKRFLQAVEAQLERAIDSREAEASESLSDSSLLWSLEAHLATVEMEDLYSASEALASLRLAVRALAQSGSYTPTQVRQLVIAAQILYLKDNAFPRIPDWFLKQDNLLKTFTQCFNESDSLNGQLIRLAVLLVDHQGQVPEEKAAVFSSKLRNTAESLDWNSLSTKPGPVAEPLGLRSRKAGALLILGKTMLQKGDSCNARSAYQKAVQLAESTEEQVKTRLELLEFELNLNKDYDEFARRCEEITSFGQELGPFAAARLKLELGILQWRSGALEQSKESLSDCAASFESMEQETLEAVARVALHNMGVSHQRTSTCISRLLEPMSLDQLMGRAHWLVRALVEISLDRDQVRKLVTRVPQVLAYSAQDSLLSTEARVRLIETLEELSAPPSSLLETLQNDPDPTIRKRAKKIGMGDSKDYRELLRLHTFGGFEAYYGEELIPLNQWKTKKTMYLIALLADSARGLTEETILDIFWPDSLTKGKRNLYWSLSMARACLKANDAFNPILREGGRLKLNPGQDLWHDATEFQRALEDAKTGHREKLNLSLSNLLRLYRGPYLDGCYLDWVVRKRDEFERKAGETFLHLARELLIAKLYQEAGEAAQASLQVVPYSQEAFLYLMRSEMRRGRALEALEHFKTAKKALHKEYGIEPGVDLIRCELEAKMMLG